ncbi:MAG: hypothetical protein H0W85_07640 [Methylotenera sp.]|nr:hypothetical protein [Methylotenera sp.]
MVYEKSALGYNEFTNDRRTLNVRERQVLLLVNGVRNMEELEKFFKKELLTETMLKLELEGFIYPAGSQTSTKGAQTAGMFGRFLDTQSETPPINPAKIAAVKTILLEATDDYLGLMGRTLKEKIDQCDNEADLRNCISKWHMAMRESKLGRESTDFLMEQIHQTLENKMLDAENNAEHQTH